MATTPYTIDAFYDDEIDNLLKNLGKIGAGDGIRTHDPNLGKVLKLHYHSNKLFIIKWL